MTTPTAPFPIIDNLHAESTYADQVTCFHVHQGVIRMTLERFRLNVGPGADKFPASRVVIGALCMPTDAAEAMAHGLLQFIQVNREQSAPDSAKAAVPVGRTIN